MQEKLRDYKYVDEERLQMYLEQASKGILSIWDRTTIKLSMNFKFVSLELGHEGSNIKSKHDQIQSFVKLLQKEKLIENNRPKYLVDTDDGKFVFESMLARKVIFSGDTLKAVPGLKLLAIWVSDPLEQDLSKVSYEFSGSFLYLSEGYWDDGPFRSVYSGCSALQAIANTIQGRNFFERNRSHKFEPLGRGSYDHPITKLQKLGGIVTDQRRIVSLYQKRYMSNEQCYIINGQKCRVNDLLAYPLFIAI